MSAEMTVIVDKLAAKLEVPVTHLWGVLVKQAPVDAALSAVAIVVLVAIAWFAKRKIDNA